MARGEKLERLKSLVRLGRPGAIQNYFSVIARRTLVRRGNLCAVKGYLQRPLLSEGIPTVGPLPSLGMTRGGITFPSLRGLAKAVAISPTAKALANRRDPHGRAFALPRDDERGRGRGRKSLETNGQSLNSLNSPENTTLPLAKRSKKRGPDGSYLAYLPFGLCWGSAANAVRSQQDITSAEAGRYTRCTYPSYRARRAG